MNIFNVPPGVFPEEFCQVIASSSSMRIERIVSTGQSSPDGFWYDQDEDEWVVLIQGSATLAFEDDIKNLSAGDCILIPAHCKHRINKTTTHPACIWLCVFGQFDDHTRSFSTCE